MNQILPPFVFRVLFAVPFAVFGVMHLLSAEQMQGMVPSYVPGGIMWIYITGSLLIASSVALIVNKFAKAAGYLLGFMLIGFIAMIHVPALLAGDQNAMGGLLKDFSLMAAAFFIGNFSAK